MSEHVENLTCPAGHSVEVHWESGQKAKQWQCPTCLEQFHHEQVAAAVADAGPAATPEHLHTVVQQAGQRAHEQSLVSFGSSKRTDR